MMPDIVLRDRNGKPITFHGAKYIDAVAPDGSEVPFAVYDPETLTADNIKIGVEIGDVLGKMVIPDREEKTVDLDFSQGNIMTVMPSTGDELLFNESGVTFAPNPAANNMCLAMDASGFAFEIGSEYQVHWDGTVFDCVAYDAAPMDALTGGTGSVAIGNGTVFGLQGNNEPFVFGTVLIGGSCMAILGSLLDTAEATHDVKIYKKIGGGNEKVLTQVNIIKPSDLKPDNIVKGATIAGIEGAFEAGGGDCLAVFNTYSAQYRATSKSSSVKPTVSITFPPKSIILSWTIGSIDSSVSTSTRFYTNNPSQSYSSKPTISTTDTGVTVSITGPTYGVSSPGSAHVFLLSVAFSVPGLYIRESERFEIYADETFEKFPEKSNMNVYAEVADLSKSKITKLPDYCLRNAALKEIILPSTLTEISTGVFPADCEVIDMTRLSAVPTLSSASSITGHDNLQIKVPAALYDQWVSATNWSSLASYIVPV